MITTSTKVKLLIFVAITLLGVSFVGARYAQLDRLFMDKGYTVSAKFSDSGGIFANAEVTYRGVTIGRVSKLDLTKDGVTVKLDIENTFDKIPADTRAIVGNRSAVGEQYVELQPQSNGEPFLKDGSTIEQSRTAIPITTTTWLKNTQELVNSVGKKNLRTVVREFGAAFKDTGDDLGQLIDSQNSFIRTANKNFELTQTLIRESNVVLGTQIDKASAIRSFAKDLRLFSDTLAGSDKDLRRVITNGSAGANTLRNFLEENDVDLAKLINNLVTVGKIQVKHLDGTRMILILYPYVVAGGFVVNSKSPKNAGHDGAGFYNAHFGLILTEEPHVCREGYRSTDRRPPQDGSNRPMNEKAHCAEPAVKSNPRGAQHAPKKRVAPGQAPVLGTYDRSTGEFTYADEESSSAPDVSYTGGAHASFGEESWKWLLLQPVME